MLSRIRNRFTVFSAAAFLFGVGMTLFFPFAPNIVSEHIAKALAYVGIGFIVLAIGLFVYGFLKTPVRTKSELYKINPILRKMHKRLLQLVDKEKNKAIDWELYIKTNNEINKALLGVAPSKAKSVKGARIFISKVEAHLKEQFGDKVIKFPEALVKLQQVSNVLDGRGFGLKKQRETDKKYLKFTSTLDNCRDFAPPQINDMVKDHITVSEIGANALLATYRAAKHREKIEDTDCGVVNIMPLEIEAGFGALEKYVEDFLHQIRAAIVEGIQELEDAHGYGEAHTTTG